MIWTKSHDRCFWRWRKKFAYLPTSVGGATRVWWTHYWERRLNPLDTDSVAVAFNTCYRTQDEPLVDCPFHEIIGYDKY